MSVIVTQGAAITAAKTARVLSAHSFESGTPVELLSDDPRECRSIADIVFGSALASAGPSAPAEISGFWLSVENELFLGECWPEGRYSIDLVRALRIEGLLKRNPRSLSGGETAKVVLASRLLVRPTVLFVDGIFEEIDLPTRAHFAEYVNAGFLDTLLVTAGSSLLPGRRACWDTRSDTIEVKDSTAPAVGLPRWWRGALNLQTLGSVGSLVTPQLTLEDVSCERDGTLIFQKVGLRVPKAAVALILGPNGAGKSTLMECIAGLLAFEGRIFVEGRDVRKGTSDVVSYSPQDPDQDVVEGALFDEVATSAREGAERVLRRCGVPSDVWRESLWDNPGLKKVASVLSAVARQRPVCLLDEPTLSCAAVEKSWVIAAILYQTRNGGSAILCSHDGNFLDELAERIQSRGKSLDEG